MISIFLLKFGLLAIHEGTKWLSQQFPVINYLAIKIHALLHTSTDNWFSTKGSKTYIGEKGASSINDAEKTGYLHVEK
jgi:hypothetical protein